MKTNVGCDMQSRLNGHFRRIVQIHFHPDTGTPYWTRAANRLGLDPERDLQRYVDLSKLGEFDADCLRTLPVADFVPRCRLNFADYSPRVFETGGSSGTPKRIIDTVHQENNARWVCEALAAHGFGRRGNWLNLFPSGPHAVSLFTFAIARKRGELCYFVDIDPRWVKQLIRRGQQETLNDYLDHVIAQALSILDTQDIRYLFTTAKLLDALMAETDLARTNLNGIVCGGTQITKEHYRYLKNEALPNIDFCALYGNTLMGVAPQAPSHSIAVDAPPWSIRYYSQFPHFIIEAVDEDGQLVGYGQRGRVRITVLNDDLFIPLLLERDTGVRVSPCDMFSWDGIADIAPYESKDGRIVEGVY